MSGNLKALGLALLAALALSAVAAGSASASVSVSGEELFHAAEYEPGETGEAIEHVILDGTEDSAQQLFETAAGSKVICTELNISGTVNEATTSEVSVTPVYENCKVVKSNGEEFAAHVEFTGCYYILTSKKVEGHAPVHIECPTTEGTSEHQIHVKATFLGFKIQCITIPMQTPTGGGVTYINTLTEEGVESDDITVEATVQGIEYTTHTNCEGKGEPYETLNDAEYKGNVEVWGTDTEEGKVDIWWD